jgi:hypothetical protein
VGYISGNTFIYTRRGIKFIKDIQIGDEILTHTGEFRYVENIVKSNEKKDTICLYHGSGIETKNPMFLIPDQEIYMENGEWVQAQLISEGFVIPNIWKYIGSTPQNFSIGGHIVENDKDMAFILGAYIARGFIDKNNVVFKFKTKAQSDGALNQIEKVFGNKYNVKTYGRNVGRGYVGGIEIVGSEVGDFFIETFGEFYNGKFIPEWVSGMDKVYRKEVFRGIKTSPLWKDEKCFISIGPTLAYQVLLLGRSIDLYGWFHSEIQSIRLSGINKAFFGNKNKVNKIVCIEGRKEKLFSLQVSDGESFVAGDFIVNAE